MSTPRFAPHPEMPDSGESKADRSAYRDAVTAALTERDTALEAQQGAIDGAAAALLSTLASAVDTLSRSDDDDMDTDLATTVDATTTALTFLLPQATPSRAVALWRQLGSHRDAQLSLIRALPPEARAQLTVTDVGALAHHVGPGHKAGALQQFLLEGGTGVPAVDAALFRQVAEHHPTRMLAVLERGGALASALSPTDVAPPLRARSTDVRTRALMAMSTLGLAPEGTASLAQDAHPVTTPHPSAPAR